MKAPEIKFNFVLISIHACIRTENSGNLVEIMLPLPLIGTASTAKRFIMLSFVRMTASIGSLLHVQWQFSS